MRIALDAIGGDFGLSPNIEGAVRAVSELGCDVVLAGPGDGIRAELSRHGVASDDSRFEILDTPDVIDMHDEPARACKDKPRSSIMLATDAVADGKAQAVVSAGHSGATMVASLWRLKRLPGVLRPAIACPLPTAKGTSVLLDGGANTECKPWHLLQFATMGALYARHVLKTPRPKIGILSIGEEESKGNEVVREAIPLLKYSGLDFYGPVEGRDIPAGTVDVIVCDGFVGNICLKLMEGTASTIFSLLKAEIEKSWIAKAGGLLIRSSARSLKDRMSYEEYGGAPLLGVGGTSLICHGKSTPRAIFNALRVAKNLVDVGANDQIRAALDQMKATLEPTRTAPASE